MSKETKNEYRPDSVSPPGATLAEALEELNLSQGELADRIGRSRKMVNEIVQGKSPITPETALQLERALGIPAHFWVAREAKYRCWLADKEEYERLKQDTSFVRSFPIKEMRDLGWLPDTKDAVALARGLLNFFGVASADKIKLTEAIAFRRNEKFVMDPWALAAWLRCGEGAAQRLQCADYDGEKFLLALRKARKLTRLTPKEFLVELTTSCARAGVAVVFVPELPKVRLNGAARWLKNEKPLVQLTLRSTWEDAIWFSFFHEAGHIYLGHAKGDMVLDETPHGGGGIIEQEANEFARNLLIPSTEWVEFLSGATFTERTIQKFAERLEISAAIVLGRLQHEERLDWKDFRRLKRQFTWESWPQAN